MGGAEAGRIVVPAAVAGRHIEERLWLLTLILIVLTFLAYQPVWRAGFIWDDDALVVENPMIGRPTACIDSGARHPRLITIR